MASITQISGTGTLNTSSGTKIASSSTTSGSTTSTSTSSSSTTGKSASELKTQFMNILLTQMQHQNPLDPMDTKEFTAQLAQFSSLEQQVATNTKLDSLLSAMTTSATATSFGYIGQTVELSTPTSVLQNGKVGWKYAINEDAETMKVKVMNKTGTVLYEKDLKAVSTGSYALDLTSADLGSTVKDGDVLTLKIQATNKDGTAISAESTTTAKVDGVETTSTGVNLRAGGIIFAPSDIRKIIVNNSTTTTTQAA